jgi:hypothetical protein
VDPCVVMLTLCGSADYADCRLNCVAAHGMAGGGVGITRGVGSRLFLPIEGGSVMTTKASPVRVRGPLACYAQGFSGELTRLGYTPLSAAKQSHRMANLSRWLAGEDLGGGSDRRKHEEILGGRRAEKITRSYCRRCDFLSIAQDCVRRPTERVA